MSDLSLCIGILTENSLQQHALCNVVQELGYRAIICRCSENPCIDYLLTLSRQKKIDAWIIDVEFSGLQIDQLDLWLEENPLPVIIEDGTIPPSSLSPDYTAWSRRLREKLQQIKGTINLSRQIDERAEFIWVLAASTGGPKAVNTFLRQLPQDLGLGFVYVQHIDAEFDKTLAKAVVKDTHFSVALASDGGVICKNSIVVIATDKVVEIHKNGTLTLTDNQWPGPYQPSVNEIIANVAHTHGRRSGAIIFTGMGDDGAVSARLMHQQGGIVWAQSPESCTSASMPEAALETGCVSFEGTPQSLALQLINYTRPDKTLAMKSPTGGN